MAKILLVEDDKSLREIYGVRLQAEGYEIVSAGDGEEALAMAIKERPDLIVSDVMMPKISGFDMLDILRSTTETKNVKVIMMTALSSEDQRARGEALGADRYLVKSQVGIEDVVRTVHDVLGDSIAPIAAPSFPPAAVPVAATVEPTVAPLPVTPLATSPFETPIAPPAPEAAPAYTPAPLPEPVQTFAPTPAPEPVQTAAPVPTFEPLPIAPAPVYAEVPVAPAPVSAPAFEAQPVPGLVVPTPLPQPTAPLTNPTPVAPAPTPVTSSAPGERVISPISDFSAPATPVLDLASQMDQALNGTSTPPTPPTPPTV